MMLKKFTRSVLLPGLILLSATLSFAQNPSLIKDVNTISTQLSVISAQASPANGNAYFSLHNLTSGKYSLGKTDGFTSTILKEDYFDGIIGIGNAQFAPLTPEINGVLYFKASTTEFGQEVWRTDGTVAGTFLLYNNAFASQSNYSDFMANVDGTLFYGVTNEQAGIVFQLWKSDGTTEGTVMVKDLGFGSPSVNSISKYAIINNKLFFTGYSPTVGYEMWVSDGTGAGTFLLKDIVPGGSSDPQSFAVLNNTLYFTATNGSGRGLWKTDGTTAGTVFVKDFDPSSTTETSGQAVVFNNQILLNIGTTASGKELWKSDGTASGTQLLKEILPGGNSSNPNGFTAVANIVLFIANDGAHGNELWKTDGTSAGTQLVLDIRTGNANGDPHVYDLQTTNVFAVTPINGKGYFFANNGINGYEPWVTDGTAAGTFILADAESGPGSSNVDDQFYPLNSGKVAFRASLVVTQYKLWVTDRTPAGTINISNAIAGIPDDIMFLANGDRLYFSKEDNNIFNFKTLWSTDGTAAGTSEVPFISGGTQSSGGGVFYELSPGSYLTLANDGSTGTSLFYSNGSTEGTYKIKNFFYSTFPLPSVSISRSGINGNLFLTVQDPDGGSLWITDGTESGTKKIITQPLSFTWGTAASNNIFYYTSGNSSNDELWRSDGTTTGTYQVTDLGSAGSDHIQQIAVFENEVYFGALGGGNNTVQLWKTNGLPGGEALIKSFGQYTFTDIIQEFKVYNGKLYFIINDGVNGEEVWSTDGTASGTALLKNIAPGGQSSDPYLLTVSGDYLFFRATKNASGDELWRTDGTENGTQLVKDIFAGSESAYPLLLTDISGTLFFTALDDNGNGLWKSDGTEEGTVKVLAFVSGAMATQILDVDGDAYFIGYRDEASLWKSDGTACHTEQIDLEGVGFPGIGGLITVGPANELYFQGTTSITGVEPYKYLTTPIVSVEICNGLDDDCNGLVDDNPTVLIAPEGEVTACKGETVTLQTDFFSGASYQWMKNGAAINGATGSNYATTKGGNFSVGVNTSGGCQAESAATHINRVENPEATILPLGSTDICTTGFVDLEANDGAGYQYQWFRKNKLLTGATNQIYTATKTGDYKVEVTNNNGCSKLSQKTTVVSSCKQFTETGLQNSSLVIYPNPAQQLLNIKSDTEDAGTLLISNLLGEIVYLQAITSAEMSIDVSSFATGIYIIELRSGEGTITKKFMKE